MVARGRIAMCCPAAKIVEHIDRGQAWACPNMSPKVTLLIRGSWPQCNMLFHGPPQVHIVNGFLIHSDLFARITNV